MDKMLAITAIGPDRTGLVRDLSEAVTRAGCNIEESRMTALGSEFAVLMLVRGNWNAIRKLRESLDRAPGEAELTITIRETEPRSTRPAAPYSIDVISLDREGIVLGLSEFFAARDLEITDLSTRRYNAPHTGAAMFAVQMTVNLPAEIHVASLREEFLAWCDEENLDAIMEPAQGC